MKDILIFTPFAYWNVHTAYELTIAKGLQIRGARLLHLTCDKDIPFCDIHDGSFSESHICHMCISNQQKYFNALKMKHHNLKEIYQHGIKELAVNTVDQLPDRELDDFHFDGKPLATWIKSSIYTYFRINEIDFSDPKINKKFRDFLKSGIILYDTFKNLLDNKKPDVLFMFNGRFFTFRIPLELALERNIRTIVHDRGYRNSTIMFRENEVIQGTKTLRKLWNDRKNIALNNEQLEQTQKYIKDREQGVNTGWYSWAKDKSDLNALKNELNINDKDIVYSFFTSSDDEMAAFKEWKGIYNTQKDFIIHLSDYFKSNPDKKLFIRIHPNTGKTEGNRKENTQFLNEINSIKDSFTDNIRIIYPEEQLNSYQLIELSTAVITYFSTVAIEAIVRKKPALVTGGGPYKGLEFLETINIDIELFDAIEKLPNITIDIEKLKLAYRFVYNYFILSGFDFSLITQKDPITPVVNYTSIEELKPGQNNDLDKICNAILFDKKIYDLPAENPNKFDEEENLFFTEQISQENLEIVTSDKKDLKKISVIIPTYNRADILKMALDALSAQTIDKKDFEVIVCDDGSKDSTEEMINGYNSDFDLIYIKQKNSGPGAARNKAIHRANSELILIINDDTICEPDNLEQHLIAQEQIGEQKLAVLGTFSFLKQAQKKPFIYFAENSSMIFAYNIMEENKAYNYRYFWTCNISIKKSALLEAGLFDEDFSEPMMEDTEIGYRLQKAGYKVFYYPKARSVHYDYNLDSKQFAKRQKMLGRNVVKFLFKHPEMFSVEHKLFGFSSLNDNALAVINEQLEKAKEHFDKNYELMQEIDALEIFNPNFIPINQNRHITGKELLEIMNKSAAMVHMYCYLSGVLEEARKIPSDIRNQTYDKSQKSNSNKPKILLTMYGWNETGGGTMFPKEVAKEIAKRGYDVAVFFAGQNKTNEPYYLEKSVDCGVQLYGLYNRHSNFLYINEPLLEIEDKNVLETFNKVLDEFKPDIVHYFNFLGLSYAIADEVHKRGIRSVYSPENYHMIDPALYMFTQNFENWKGTDFLKNSEHKNELKANEYKLIAEKALDILNNKIDYTLNISDRVKEILIDFGADKNRMKTVHQIPYITKLLSEETKNTRPKDNKIRFGFIGTVLPHKGVHNIVLAAQKVPADKAEFLIYGFGNPDYINELQKIDKHRNIKWMGKYAQENLSEITKNIDIMIIPSIWEECAGLVVLESIALKIPVIAARIGGMPEFIIEGENGYTYPHDSVNNLAAKINELIENPMQIEYMKKNCRMPVKFDNYVNHILTFYSALFDSEQITYEDMNFIYKKFLK